MVKTELLTPPLPSVMVMDDGVGFELQWPQFDHAVKAPGTSAKTPRVGHTKSRNGCAQCKRRHVKCDELKPCSNCIRHGVPCSLAGGPNIPRDDAKKRRQSAASSSTTTSQHRQQDVSPSASSPEMPRSMSQRGSPTPFQMLTQILARPPIEDTIWQPDLQLMHYYTAHSSAILAHPDNRDGTQRIWQVEVPKVAFKSDFLLHALLGFSALHRAHHDQDASVALHESAVLHLDHALVLYRLQGSASTAVNADAKFLFTWIVALFAYAIPPSLPPIDAIVELFLLFKGIDVVMGETWFWVSEGPFAPIFTKGFQEVVVAPESNLRPPSLNLSIVYLDFILGLEPADQFGHDRDLCARVLAELRNLYEAVFTPGSSSTVAAILCFPKNDAAAFAQLLRRRSPPALVLLAHYCVLLEVLGDRWWIKAWGKCVLGDVVQALEPSWRQWIEWPVMAVLGGFPYTG